MAIDGLAQMITVLASLFHKIRGIIYSSTYVDELKKLNGLESLLNKQTMYDLTLKNRTERNKD